MDSTLLLICSLLITFVSGTTYTCDSTASCGCSSVSSTLITSRIVGGEAAGVHAWGWMVSLQANNGHLCGGSLLTAEYAVTGAHCFPSWLQGSQYSILVGTNYLNDTTSATIQRRLVTETHVHPNFDADALTNDIAIVRFAPLSVGSNSTLSFICLPTNGTDPFVVGSDLVAIGWGKTSFTSATASNYLQQVTLNAYASNSTQCKNAQISNDQLQFCASVATGAKDTCQGDSGGPLMAFTNNRWVLAGLTSYGFQCAVSGYAGVYTRVSSLVSFVRSIVTTAPTMPQVVPSISTTTIPISSSTNASPYLSRSILDTLFLLLILSLC